MVAIVRLPDGITKGLNPGDTVTLADEVLIYIGDDRPKMPEKVDLSIVSSTHRRWVSRELGRAFSLGKNILSTEARFQILQEELAKLILGVIDDEDDGDNL